MLKSMTGYGLGKTGFASGLLTVEIKSLNYRYLEIIIKLPDEIAHFEKNIKDAVQSKVSRGRINVTANIEKQEFSDDKFSVNKKAVASYYKALKKIKRDHKIKGEIGLGHILNCPDAICTEKKGHSDYKKWNRAKTAFNKAVEDLLKSRLDEGKFIYNDLLKRANNIEKLITKIKKRLPLVIKEEKKKYLNKAAKYNSEKGKHKNAEYDFSALSQNYDVTEEITRINAHTKTLKKSLKSKDEIGKKLDFIAQELIRESNTVASKTQDYIISNSVIEIKAEIEKIREQVQNVE
jgi:uncharacterized protein (TIGR00255 family)